jgi:hypothetical protein
VTKIKHGEYDRERGIPDNRGQPNGSGLFVWLLDEVRAHFPDDSEDLIQRSYTHGDNRYQWLLEQIQSKGTPEATNLIEAYEAKRLLVAAEARQEQRKRTIDLLEERIKEWPMDTYLPRKMQRVQSEIAKAEVRIGQARERFEEALSALESWMI